MRFRMRQIQNPAIFYPAKSGFGQISCRIWRMRVQLQYMQLIQIKLMQLVWTVSMVLSWYFEHRGSSSNSHGDCRTSASGHQPLD